MGILDKAHVFKIVKNATTGAPETITDVKTELADVAIGCVTGLVDDSVVVTGVARPIQAGLAYYAGRQAERVIKGQGVALKAWQD